MRLPVSHEREQLSSVPDERLISTNVRYSIKDGVLQIQSVARIDKGEYRCSAHNEFGKISKILSLALSGKDPEARASFWATRSDKGGMLLSSVSYPYYLPDNNFRSNLKVCRQWALVFGIRIAALAPARSFRL